MQYTTYPSITSFQQHVELKDFRAPTKKEYVRYVRKLAEPFQCDPATLTEDQLREYFPFLRQHKHFKPATMKGAKYSLLCFYVEHLKQKGWSVFRDLHHQTATIFPDTYSGISSSADKKQTAKLAQLRRARSTTNSIQAPLNAILSVRRKSIEGAPPVALGDSGYFSAGFLESKKLESTPPPVGLR